MIPREVDAEIDSALMKILEFFDSNMCALFRMDSHTSAAILTHLQVTSDIPVMPEMFDYGPVAPWVVAKALRGDVILLNSLDEFPAEASADRRIHAELGIQAILVIPVAIEGSIRFALQLVYTRPGPPWLVDYIPRLQVFAKVLVTALERNRAIVAQRETELRLDLAAGLAGAGLWDLDLDTSTIWATVQARELYGMRREEPVNLDKLFSIVHHDDVGRLKHGLQSAVQNRTAFQSEYRVVLPGGEIRWLTVRGDRSPESFGGGNHFLGVSIDISERKKLEETTSRSLEEIKRLNELLQDETRYLRKEIGLTQSHAEIVGKSDAIKAVLHKVEQVAPTDTTVLITGETGTGKDLVARAIHGLSGRRECLLVKVDCASLPATLIESELFGRERGAYTGAMTKQIGRFQLADKGTIFLDEIGELARETQGKLLRVLQEGCFEVLGSPRTISVNVRFIAATNRDLAKEVREGRFREDLYYRLNVFAVEVPPLRKRTEDIPLLVWNFVEHFSKEMRKDIRLIPKETMDALVRHHWPGNVRELKNLIEQAFIISQGDKLEVRMPEFHQPDVRPALMLEEVERQHILGILKQTRWQVKGERGAAAILGLNPSSLYSKMKKLGIPTKGNRDGISS